MANHKSAIKRAKQNEVRRMRNRAVKTRVRNVVKTARTAMAEETGVSAEEIFKSAQSTIDRAAKKGVIHKRAAARKVSRLARKIGASSAS
ncbi:MAG: 30S ribosomal protein S20 [Desulfobacterales bacterium]